ncbi:MAG: hypothetical protein SOV83_08985 [Prevotella sp.]|nr:hypothetical protein [Prevotella sp.]
MNTNNEIKTFIDLYKEAFGLVVPLPVAFGYSRQPAPMHFTEITT